MGDESLEHLGKVARTIIEDIRLTEQAPNCQTLKVAQAAKPGLMVAMQGPAYWEVRIPHLMSSMMVNAQTDALTVRWYGLRESDRKTCKPKTTKPEISTGRHHLIAATDLVGH